MAATDAHGGINRSSRSRFSGVVLKKTSVGLGIHRWKKYQLILDRDDETIALVSGDRVAMSTPLDDVRAVSLDTQKNGRRFQISSLTTVWVCEAENALDARQWVQLLSGAVVSKRQQLSSHGAHHVHRRLLSTNDSEPVALLDVMPSATPGSTTTNPLVRSVWDILQLQHRLRGVAKMRPSASCPSIGSGSGSGGGGGGGGGGGLRIDLARDLWPLSGAIIQEMHTDSTSAIGSIDNSICASMMRAQLSHQMRLQLISRTIKRNLRSYEHAFLGSDIIQWFRVASWDFCMRNSLSSYAMVGTGRDFAEGLLSTGAIIDTWRIGRTTRPFDERAVYQFSRDSMAMMEEERRVRHMICSDGFRQWYRKVVHKDDQIYDLLQHELWKKSRRPMDAIGSMMTRRCRMPRCLLTIVAVDCEPCPVHHESMTVDGDVRDGGNDYAAHDEFCANLVAFLLHFVPLNLCLARACADGRGWSCSRALDLIWYRRPIDHICTLQVACDSCLLDQAKFNEFIATFCSGEQCGAAVKQALIGLLIDDTFAFHKSQPFNQHFANPLMVSACFEAIKGDVAKLVVRDLMNDLAILTLDRWNATMMRRQLAWTQWLLPMMLANRSGDALALVEVDVVSTNGQPVAVCTAVLAQSIVSAILYWAFLDRDDDQAFERTLTQVVHQLQHLFQRSERHVVCERVLTSVASRLTTAARQYPPFASENDRSDQAGILCHAVANLHVLMRHVLLWHLQKGPWDQRYGEGRRPSGGSSGDKLLSKCDTLVAAINKLNDSSDVMRGKLRRLQRMLNENRSRDHVPAAGARSRADA